MHRSYFAAVPGHLSAEQLTERARRLPVIQAKLAHCYPGPQEPEAELIETLQRYLNGAALTAEQAARYDDFLRNC